jgi:hypothetical protein
MTKIKPQPDRSAESLSTNAGIAADIEEGTGAEEQKNNASGNADCGVHSFSDGEEFDATRLRIKPNPIPTLTPIEIEQGITIGQTGQDLAVSMHSYKTDDDATGNNEFGAMS